MTLAPIVLFVYNRPDNTLQTLNALSENEEAKSSVLHIYCDGSKNKSDNFNLERIKNVRSICENENRFKEVVIVEREENLGLASSIISGVTEIVNKFGKVIVLEDDIFTSKYFLKFMNDALNLYQNHSKVISIGACNYFVLGKKYSSSFFAPIPDCLGWATWADRWKLFESDSNKLLAEISERNLIERFNLYGCYNFSGMLKDQAEGKVSSWAIRWQAIAYLNDMITLYPNPSVTHHLASSDSTHANDLNIKPPLAINPINITEENNFVKIVSYYLMIKAYYLYFDNRFLSRLKKSVLLYKIWMKNKKRIIAENNLIN